MEDVSKKIDALTAKLSGDELVELAVGIAARGLYRIKTQNGAQEAADTAEALSSTTTSMHLDFRRLAAKALHPEHPHE